jgi:hypothetical protein
VTDPKNMRDPLGRHENTRTVVLTPGGKRSGSAVPKTPHIVSACLVLGAVFYTSPAAAASGTGDDVTAIVVLFVLLAIYFLPSIIANQRRHHNLTALFFLDARRLGRRASLGTREASDDRCR